MMPVYRIRVQENLTMDYEVEAEDESEARHTVESYWQGEGRKPYAEIEYADCSIESVEAVRTALGGTR